MTKDPEKLPSDPQFHSAGIFETACKADWTDCVLTLSSQLVAERAFLRYGTLMRAEPVTSALRTK